MITNQIKSDAFKLLVLSAIDDGVCGKMLAAVDSTNGSPFTSEKANVAARSIAGYYRRHSAAPNGHFDLLVMQAADGKREEEIDFLELLADKVRTTPKPLTPSGRAEGILLLNKEVSKSNLDTKKEVSDELASRGKLKEAHEALATPPPDITTAPRPQQSVDFGPWLEYFSEEEPHSTDVVTYPAPLTRFMSGLARGTLFAFLGSDKSGKSFFLLDLVYRALRQGNKVAYFEVGDLGREEAHIRLAERILRRPRLGGNYALPVGFDGDGKPKLVRTPSEPIVPGEVFASIKRLCQKRDLLSLCCDSTSQLSVNELRSRLLDWRQTGWEPSVVVIDYADILALPSTYKEKTDQTDEMWKQLRRLSQDLNCLVVTATQAKATGYGKKKGALLGPGDFSDSKSKNAHANGIIGINYVTEEDKRDGIVTLGWVVRRKGRASKSARIATCFACARAIVVAEEQHS